MAVSANRLVFIPDDTRHDKTHVYQGAKEIEAGP
jgi:hypothetical protein